MMFDPVRDLAVHWPGASAAVADLLKGLGAQALLTEKAPADLKEACAQAGIGLVADLGETPDAGQALSEAKAAGFDAASIRASGEAANFRKIIGEFRDFVLFVQLSPEQISWDVAPAHAVLRYGVWPGIATPDPSVAGATESIWLDANTSLIAQLRAQYPKRRAILGYRPDKEGGVPETRSVPMRSAEVALADAFSAGGSVILSLPGDYRKALLERAPRALEAWKELAKVLAFLRRETAVTDRPLAGKVAVLCGTIEQSGEILNLAFRRNLCPVAMPADAPQPLTPERFDVVVAANLIPPPPVVESLARYAAAGGSIMAAPEGEEKNPWWTQRGFKKLRTEEDRDVYAAGKGTIYAYQTAILDPGVFAMDLKELAGERSQPGFGVKNFDLRIWAADSVLGVLHRLTPTSLAVVLTAYGNAPRHDFLVSLRGQFRKATIRQIGSETAAPVAVMQRSGRVELNLTQLSRIAILTVEG